MPALAKEPVEKKPSVFDLTDQVLNLLGTPPDLFKVESKHVFGNWYRVNVRVKNTSNNLVTVTNIPHSYLLRTDNSGKVVDGDEIVKVYD